MKQIIRWALRIALALVLAAAVVGFWKRDDIRRLLAVNSLFEAENITHNFSHMDDLFFNADVPRGTDQISPLVAGPLFDLPPEVESWIADRSVTALVILQDGKLRHESYYLDTGPDDRRISWSVAKSFLSALTGILIDEGTIPSLDVQVTDYAPSLKGSAYDGVTLRNVLQMSSGVKFNEDYLDYNSDINRMGRVLALGGSMDDFAASLKESAWEPGTHMHYVSIDTHVLGMVLRGASGRTITDLMTGKILSHIGLEADPYYLTDGYGVEFVLGGLNLRTRDYARFGQLFAQGGAWDGQQVVPRDWVDASTVPSAPTDAGSIGYGYQWWIPQGGLPGQFTAQGIYGQFIWIDRGRNIVIAVNSSDRDFENQGVQETHETMFRHIADLIAKAN